MKLDETQSLPNQALLPILECIGD